MCLCIVVDGEINILKQTNPADDHIKIAEIKSGASIGEMGVVDGQPLSATAVTSKDSTVLIITRDDFQNLMKKNSNLGVKVLLKIAEIISVRLRHTTGRLADILALNKD